MEGVKDLVYPIIEASYRDPRHMAFNRIPECCFHDLRASEIHDLSGMGLAILGNVIKMAQANAFPPGATLRLQLTLERNDLAVDCPWPGMPTDNPDLPLDLDKLPFDTEMFIGNGQDGKKRVDRLQLLDRIEGLWTVWLIEKIMGVQHIG